MTVVAVTAHRRSPDGRERVHLNGPYITALERVGLMPLVLPTSVHPSIAAGVLSSVRGLVLSGGEDVDPVMYGADPHPCLGPVDRHRDEVEAKLVRSALTARIPVLAICRGLQILNVAIGGSLYQDLPSEHPGSIAHDREPHDVEIDRHSLLFRTLHAPVAHTNSRHHQSVKDIAPGLTVVARAPDGVVEAVELLQPGGQWLIGVQWHPEDMTDPSLFQAFAEAALGVEAVG